jgi:hypothetical protein
LFRKPPQFPESVHGILLEVLQKFDIAIPLNMFSKPSPTGGAITKILIRTNSLMDGNSESSPRIKPNGRRLSQSKRGVPAAPVRVNSAKLTTLKNQWREDKLSKDGPTTSSSSPDVKPPALLRLSSTTTPPTSPATPPTSPTTTNVTFQSTGSSWKKEKGSLIPSLLPEERPTQVKDLWPLFEDKMHQFARFFRFSFLPMGFFSRCIARTLLLPDVESLCYWKNGIVLSLRTNSDDLTSSLDDPKRSGAVEECKALLEFLPAHCQLKVQIRMRKLTNQTLTFSKLIVESISTLVNCWYKSQLLEESIPCTHCYAQRSYDPFHFSLKDCQLNLTKRKQYLYCRGIWPVRIGM